MDSWQLLLLQTKYIMSGIFCQYCFKNPALRMLRVSATICAMPVTWFPNHAVSGRRMHPSSPRYAGTRCEAVVAVKSRRWWGIRLRSRYAVTRWTYVHDRISDRRFDKRLPAMRRHSGQTWAHGVGLCRFRQTLTLHWTLETPLILWLWCDTKQPSVFAPYWKQSFVIIPLVKHCNLL